MKWIQTQNTYFKNTTICFNWKEAIWSLTEKKENIRKQERKTNRIIALDHGGNDMKVK